MVDGLNASPEELERLITIKTAECEGIETHGDDHVIEVDNKSLTHRPDLWGHYGMAREVAAITALDKAVGDGSISVERLEQSLARIARLKQRFVQPYRPVVISDAKLIVGCRSHRALLHSIHQTRERLAKATV